MDEQDQLIALYRRLTANTPWLFERIEAIRQSAGNHDEGGHLAKLNANTINEYKSKIKNKLIQGFGQQASSILITSVGKKPDTRYGISLDKGRIEYIVRHNLLDEP